MHKVRGLVLYFFELKLRVSFNSILTYINKNSEIAKFLFSKSFKFAPEHRSYLASMFILVSIETDLPKNKRGSK